MEFEVVHSINHLKIMLTSFSREDALQQCRELPGFLHKILKSNRYSYKNNKEDNFSNNILFSSQFFTSRTAFLFLHIFRSRQ